MWDGARRIPLLAAPTASGKTAAALALGERLPLEVVSADAMQVYRGLDVGTAKPDLAERRRVPHHLVDVVDPEEPFDVVRFVDLAEDAIAAVLARGRLPLVAGGTGFYLQALIEGVPGTPVARREVQASIERDLTERGLEPLLAELHAASPEDALRTQRNPRRVVRALEVLRQSGAPPSHHPRRTPRFTYAATVLLPDPTELAERIRARTRAQLAGGWIEEVRHLLPGMDAWTTAAQAIGYAELRRHLEGRMSLDEAVARIDVATLRYAKRQRTWFRRRPEPAVRIAAGGEAAVDRLASGLQALIAGPQSGEE